MAAPAPSLVDRLGRPLAAAASGQVGAVTRTAGGHGGTMAGWYPRRHTDASAPRERELIARRAEELVANDAHAAGLVDSIAVNVAGTGLRPQANIDAQKLGIDEEAAAAVCDSIEAAFALWSLRADAGGRMTFDQLQFLNMRTAMIQGEYLNLCVSKADAAGNLSPDRHFALALQSLSPARLGSPFGTWYSSRVKDGVELAPDGEPVGYWIAQPDATGRLDLAGWTNAVRYPAAVAHRKVVLHGFPQRQPEQVRGVSVLAPAMKFFRDLADCLDAELVGQLVASSFPVAITSDQSSLLQALGPSAESRMQMRPDGEQVADILPGSILRLYQGEDIKALESPRPGNNFDNFVTRILRAAGAQAGLPYEVVVKDFSKTNYSSARAALLEAWRVFQIYQQWLEYGFCRPCWRMVTEEAFARGMVELPPGAPDFYASPAIMEAYLACDWIPPRRGHIDPVKEMQADLDGNEAGVVTHQEIIASRGGDWEAVYRQLKREQDRRKKLDLAPPPAAPAVPAPPPADATPSEDQADKPSGTPPDDGQPNQAEAAAAAVLAATPAGRSDVHASLARLQAVCRGQTLPYEVRT